VSVGKLRGDLISHPDWTPRCIRTVQLWPYISYITCTYLAPATGDHTN